MIQKRDPKHYDLEKKQDPAIRSENRDPKLEIQINTHDKKQDLKNTKSTNKIQRSRSKTQDPQKTSRNKTRSNKNKIHQYDPKIDNQNSRSKKI